MNVYTVMLRCSGPTNAPHKTVPIKPPINFWWSDARTDVMGGNEILIDESPVTDEETRLVFGGAYGTGRDPAWSAAHARTGRSRHVRRCGLCGLRLEALPSTMQSFADALARSPLTPWVEKSHRLKVTIELRSVISHIQHLGSS